MTMQWNRPVVNPVILLSSGGWGWQRAVRGYHCESTVEPRLTLCQGNVRIISFKTGYHYSRIPGKVIYRDTIKEQGG